MKKPRIPTGNTSNGPRCAVCGESGKRMVIRPSGRWCEECLARYRGDDEPLRVPDPGPRHYYGGGPGGWMPADGRTVTIQEYPNISSKPAPNLGPEATVLYDMIAKSLVQHRQMLNSAITRINVLEGRIAAQNDLIHEQTETIKDLIEELSE